MASSTFTNSDEVMSSIQAFFDVLAKHSRLVIGFGVLVAIVGASMAIVATRKEEKSDAGRNALYRAQKNLDVELAAIAKADAPAVKAVSAEKDKKAAKPETPGPDTIMFKKLDVDAQLAGAVANLKAVSEQYAGTSSGMEAMLSLGKLYLNHGEPAKGEEWFRKAAKAASTSLDRAVAWSSVADSLEDEGKPQDALKAIEQAQAAGVAVLTGDLLLDQARIYESLKQTAQAKALYQQIQSQYPNTDYAKLAMLYSARL